MIKAIAFDLQFTLVTFSTEILGFSDKFTLSNWFKLFDEGFKEVLKYIKTKDIKFDEKKLFRTLKRIRNRYFARTVSGEQRYFTKEILSDTFSKVGIILPDDEIEKCVLIYHGEEIKAWKPVKNLNTIIKRLSKDYKLAILTNAIDYVGIEILKRQGIHEYFDLIIGDARKPKHDNFIKFQEFMKAEMNELIMVGDDIKADIEPAIQLGMKSIQIHRGYEYLRHHAKLNITPDKRINDLNDIFMAIQELTE